MSLSDERSSLGQGLSINWCWHSNLHMSPVSLVIFPTHFHWVLFFLCQHCFRSWGYISERKGRGKISILKVFTSSGGGGHGKNSKQWSQGSGRRPTSRPFALYGLGVIGGIWRCDTTWLMVTRIVLATTGNRILVGEARTETERAVPSVVMIQ